MASSAKVSQVFEQKRSAKGSNLSHLEVQVGQALQDAVNHYDGENKKTGSAIRINRVVEVPLGKDKPAFLVFVNFRSQRLLVTNLYKKLVNDLEKKLKTTVLIVAARNIESRWIKANRTQQRSNSRTLTNVYNEYLNELLLPGSIISSRTRVRLDGSSITKITLDKADQHFLEERVPAIRAAYKKLTSREIEVDFQKEATYYVLKKGERR
jgi:hypothetical protein